jgi:MFS family permease
MQRRWSVLAILFLARMSLAYQFQTIAAITPVLRTELVGFDLGDAGLLIGLYLLPGMVLPLAGGAISHVAGDRFAVTLGFVLAIVGGLIPILLPGWTALVVGRLLAGAGGIMVSVIMTKMVADWFANSEIAGAMAVFVNCWPAGIIIALFSLPTVAASWGSHGAFIVSTVIVGCGLALFLGFYGAMRSDAIATDGAARPRVAMSRGVIVALIAAGLIWACYNVASTITFSFGVTLLTERGYSAAAAASTVTLVLFVSMVSVPLGGFFADRVSRASLILIIGSVMFAALLVAAGRSMQSALIFAAIGLVGGFPVGVIMQMPARMLRPEQRAIGMGIFYTIYYGGLVLGTAVGGELADRWETSSAAFDFAAVLVAVCPLLLLAVRQSPAHAELVQTASKAG